MLKISIPTPCHEDWNKMIPDETGRYCSSCAKSVVDFTAMSDEEVKYFFLNKKEDERVCGRFKQTQLHRIVIELPQNIFSIQMPLWKKFLAACLVVFSTTLFSCETKITADVTPQVQVQQIKPNTISDHVMLGGIGYSIMPDSIKPIEVCTETVGIIAIKVKKDTVINELQGDITLPPEDSVIVIKPDRRLFRKGEVKLKDTFYTSFTRNKLKINDSVTPVKTKNPPKADSNNCNTIKNYY